MRKDCLFPACQRGPFTRGLCKHHYEAARLLVHQKKTSWEELENTGRVLKPGGNKSTREVSKAWFVDGVEP